MSERKEGYYWVLYEGEWQIANYLEIYSGGNYGWYLFGTHDPEKWNCPSFTDKHFAEIDERRVERADEKEEREAWGALCEYANQSISWSDCRIHYDDFYKYGKSDFVIKRTTPPAP